ncbi:FecR domain-containing protein [Methylosinus sp. H3A]|uniref:FecR family protein n=1 Tax=Methylosinus sp. H3A TaxID=2785786 RepID=UPI0018C25C21|nr:FecR domain-containing protein [Methylosinus sp. H3A]MBG0811571.1 FecR domain-containing protein [Methylosinus sp. H3A]
MTTDDGALHAAAIEWWIRETAGELVGEARAEFDAWLAADPAHARAYADISGMFAQARELRPARRPQQRLARPGRAAAWGGLLAASIAIAVWFGDLSLLWRADHSTGVGERRTAILADGSRVELDGASAVAIHFEAGRRRVRLLAGEAWFEVAPDPARPFVVEAAGGEVTALGTAFDVALTAGGARVAVGEHRVAVASGGGKVIVAERQQTSFAAEAPAARPGDVAAEAIGAWRRGALVVEDRPLGEVLATFGRHRHGRVYCLWPSICARRVSGVFSAAEPLTALREIEFFLGLRAIHLTDYLIVLTD